MISILERAVSQYGNTSSNEVALGALHWRLRVGVDHAIDSDQRFTRSRNDQALRSRVNPPHICWAEAGHMSGLHLGCANFKSRLEPEVLQT